MSTTQSKCTPPLLHRMVGATLINRYIDPAMNSAAGKAFYGRVICELLWGRRWARPVRLQSWRNLVWRGLAVRPWQRWRFRRRYGFRPPVSVMISPSRRCNLRCQGCFADGWDAQAEMSYERVAQIIAQMDGWGAQLCIFGGGEPLCWPGFFRLVDEHPRTSFIVYTNGTLIDAECARWVARAGNVLMAVSIEGFEAEHDARRGAGSFARAMAGLRHLREAGAHAAFAVTLMRHNHDLALSDAFVDQFEELQCLMGFYLGYMPVDERGAVELMPTPEQRAYRLARVPELQRTRRLVLLDFTNAGPVATGCGAAGRMYLHINPQGDIEPCPFCHFSTHNVHTSSVLDALRAPFFSAFRAWHAAHHDARLPCPIIDRPEALRCMVAQTGARPTHPAAVKLVHEFAPALDRYSQAYSSLLAEPHDSGHPR